MKTPRKIIRLIQCVLMWMCVCEHIKQTSQRCMRAFLQNSLSQHFFVPLYSSLNNIKAIGIPSLMCWVNIVYLCVCFICGKKLQSSGRTKQQKQLKEKNSREKKLCEKKKPHTIFFECFCFFFLLQLNCVARWVKEKDNETNVEKTPMK